MATLLLELERAQGPYATRPPGDGAAPLIGSSVAIHRVRDRIEQVAATDFTVLIEGATGPQPPTSFINFSRAAALNDGYGAVERATQEEDSRTGGVF